MRTPRETIEELLRRVTDEDRSHIADLFSENAAIELPFSPEGFPTTSQGRETLRTRVKATSGLWRLEQVNVISLHETTDPEVVIAEYEVQGRVNATAEPFNLAYITVSRVRDGLIVSSRDYNNPLQLAPLRTALPT